MPGYAPVAQLDRVQPSEGCGRWFESTRARHFPSNKKLDQFLPAFCPTGFNVILKLFFIRMFHHSSYD